MRHESKEEFPPILACSHYTVHAAALGTQTDICNLWRNRQPRFTGTAREHLRVDRENISAPTVRPARGGQRSVMIQSQTAYYSRFKLCCFAETTVGIVAETGDYR